MPHPFAARALRAAMFPLVVAVALAALPAASALAQRAPAQFSGPSVVRAEPAEFNGSGFAPNQPVSISVKAPGGQEAVFGAVADAAGKLSVRVSATGVGVHVVRVLSARGGELARASMVGQP